MEAELPRIATEQVAGFMLALARVGGLFVLAPVFSARALPARAKSIVAFALAFALVPVATKGQTVPTDGLELGTLLIKEALVGLAFAFALSAIVAGVQLGAGIVDAVIGFSFASVVDPFSSIQGAVLGQLYGLFAAIVLIITGADQLMIMGLAETYNVVPLSEMPSYASYGQLALDVFAKVFLLGLEVVAPLLVALFVVDAAFAIVARAAPQMNVFVVGLPAKILVALAVVAASLPFVAGHLRSELEASVLQAISVIGG